jgi:hypothetical protein
MTKLAQVQAARTAGTKPVQEGQDIHGHKVLSAYAPVSPLGWLVFVEVPAEEAYLSVLFLARRMVVPSRFREIQIKGLQRSVLPREISAVSGSPD